MKITIKNQLRVLWYQIVGTISMFGICYFYNFDKDITNVFIIGWLVYTLPTVYLHIEYYIANRNFSLEISNTNLVVKKGEKSTQYSIDEIEKVYLYKAKNLDKKQIQIVSMESYYYFKLVTNKGEEIILTCLLDPKIDDIINGIKGLDIIRKRTPFCSIYW